MVDSKGVAGGILVFWDKKVFELLDMEVGEYSVLCHFKN